MIAIEFSWRLEGPLHVGSGHAQPGVADRLIQRDETGRPTIVGDAVKGAVRMSAEEIAAWFGLDHGLDDKSSKPKLPILSAVFDSRARVRFGGAQLQPESLSKTTVVAQTAIDQSTGVAQKTSLRQTEVLPHGAIFQSVIECDLEPDEAPFLLLLAALLATESVGAKSGVGWGRVAMDGLKVAGCPELASDADVERLLGETDWGDVVSWSPSHVDEAAAVQIPAFTIVPSDAGALSWRRLVLSLEQPVTVASAPVVSNEIHCRGEIPSTTVRGAFASVWSRSGVPPDLIAQALGPSSRWLSASPMPDGLQVVTPSPLCWFVPKGEGAAGLVNVFEHRQPPGVKMKPLAARYVTYDAVSQVVDLVAVNRIVRMHVARNYRTRSKRESALFSKEVMAPGTRLVTYALIPARLEIPETVYIGKRISAGNGKARVEVSDGSLEELMFQAGGDSSSSLVLWVQLMTDAILVTERGHERKGLAPDDWAALVGLDPAMLDVSSQSQCRTRHVFSWNSVWRLPRSPRLAVVAGSVARLVFRESKEARGALVAARGERLRWVGDACHEGFGLMALDPPWLTSSHTTLADQEQDDAALEGSQPWPGLDASPARAVELLELANSRGRAVRPEFQNTDDPNWKKLRVVGQQIRDAESLGSVTLASSAVEDASAPSVARDRESVKRWMQVLRGVEADLRSCGAKDQALFYLEALEVTLRGCG